MMISSTYVIRISYFKGETGYARIYITATSPDLEVAYDNGDKEYEDVNGEGGVMVRSRSSGRSRGGGKGGKRGAMRLVKMTTMMHKRTLDTPALNDYYDYGGTV